eukprot:1608950-Rhodomonas_salina.1
MHAVNSKPVQHRYIVWYCATMRLLQSCYRAMPGPVLPEAMRIPAMRGTERGYSSTRYAMSSTMSSAELGHRGVGSVRSGTELVPVVMSSTEGACTEEGSGGTRGASGVRSGTELVPVVVHDALAACEEALRIQNKLNGHASTGTGLAYAARSCPVLA